MTESTLTSDPSWPRAAQWLVAAGTAEAAASAEKVAPADLGIIGIPAHRTSITPTGADATPGAIRKALLLYSTYAASRGIDVASVRAVDLGDLSDPDGPDGEAAVATRVAEVASDLGLLIALGGDNSITFSVMSGLFGGPGAVNLQNVGLVTVDAHHDLRDGETNGSPVRRLLDAGLPGANVVQLGIADFSNSAAYAGRALDAGITVIHRDEFRHRPLGELVAYALGRAGEGGRPVYVDLDVDVCDRAAVPGCPAAAPGGLAADELRQIAFLAGRDPRVRAVDITEIDAIADAPDGRTVRLGALLVLEIAAGLAARMRARDT
jgi:formiminoglutamase